MASKAALKAAELTGATKIVDNKRETDTIRLWEGYRDQALLWRSLALLQIPATFISCIMALIFFYNQKITLNVPAKPLPGVYSPEEINDAEFMEASTSFINLIATYQPAVARRQFMKARELIAEPMLSKFDDDMMGAELRAIEMTRRTQLYFVDPTKYKIERNGKDILVTIVGERQKLVAGKELPAVTTKYVVTLGTIPRNAINPYGIVIKNVNVENVEMQN